MRVFCVFFWLNSVFLTYSFAQNLKSANPTQGMVLVRGGKTKIGNEAGLPNEKPEFYTHLRSFWIDIEPVTVAQFRKFAKVNRYITNAEKQGFAHIWNDSTHTWLKAKGAYWEFPKGRDSLPAQPNEPVRQISWNDAKAYANWIGKRLPSEYEWESALQNRQTLRLSVCNGMLWQWAENWFEPYEASSYFRQSINRQKTLKAGQYEHIFRESLRTASPPEMMYDNVGFRCAIDIQ
jgi:formylglycine-generating enzyme required for sulfatase activity